MCNRTLGSDKKNDFTNILTYFGKKGRVHFVHARNVKLVGDKSFQESAHLSEEGSIDMYKVIKALHDFEYEGPIRPDHGRMIWGEIGKPRYGLYDRALGATYLNGLYEAIQKSNQVEGGCYMLPFKVDLTYKTVVITSGADVIGSKLSKSLAKCGANVAIINHWYESRKR